MSDFKALKNLGKKEAVHRTKVGDQTSGVTAHHIGSHKEVASIGGATSQKRAGRVPKRKGPTGQ